jgi:hypothetical protein
MGAFLQFATVAYLLGSVVAHPGEHHDHSAIQREINLRDELSGHAKRSLNACAGSKGARELAARAVERRSQIAQELRERRGIKTRE